MFCRSKFGENSRVKETLLLVAEYLQNHIFLKFKSTLSGHISPIKKRLLKYDFSYGSNPMPSNVIASVGDHY
jgi:hypothetical protein